MQLEFADTASESDVEQAFVWPLLTEEGYLGIPNGAVRTKYTVASIPIDKGARQKRYVPDYLVYVQGLPVLVLEAKAPGEDLAEAFREAQLYAHVLNTRWAAGLCPAQFVAATDGRRIVYGHWDSSDASEERVGDLLPGSAQLARLRAFLGWTTIDNYGFSLVKQLTPSRFSSPHESLGETAVRLSKVPNNPLSEPLFPVLQRYFQSENEEFEDEIVDRAYVSSDQTTRYQRQIEDFLREKIAPLSDARAHELSPTRRDEPSLNTLISAASKARQAGGYLQLIIGAVGSGKSTFLKRYFRHLISPELRSHLLVVSINFNDMPDDLSEVNRWVCEAFIDAAFANGDPTLDRTDPECLKRIFSVEIRDNAGAYKVLQAAGADKYNERLGSDFLKWMADPVTFARAVARHVSGDRGKYIAVVFDNVDRRNRENQLSIFQTAQWFRRQTQSLCLLCLRDETYETYKNEPPLDAFLNSLHFYIRPPRFVDMVRRRLDLAIEYIADEGVMLPIVDLPGVGRVRPRQELGGYLKAVYVDLFQKQRLTTVILEGLSGKNVRRALEMFSNVLISGHIEAVDLARTMFTSGTSPVRENSLIKSLMRTNYLYFFDGHGFVRNLFDFFPGVSRPNHFIKLELLEFLSSNRKKVGDARYEGYFSVEFLVRRFVELGFPEQDIILTLEGLMGQGLVLADHLRSSGLVTTDLVRANVAGFVHQKVLCARQEYLAACALVTPLSNDATAKQIGRLWQISPPKRDISYRAKQEVLLLFKAYLEGEYRRFCETSPFFAQDAKGTPIALRQMDDVLGFATSRRARSDRGLFDD